MYYSYNKKFELLKIDDNFARLGSIAKNGDITFDFFYSVSQLEIFEKSSFKVRISVQTKNPSIPKIIQGAQPGSVNKNLLTKNILTAISSIKGANQQKQSTIIASRISDITSKINNEIIPLLKSGIPRNLIPGLTSNKLSTVKVNELSSINDVKPLLQLFAHVNIGDLDTAISGSSNTNNKNLIFSAIQKTGLDPSYVSDLTHRSISAETSLNGTLRKNKSNENYYDPISQLLNFYLFSNNTVINGTSQNLKGDTGIQILQLQNDEIIEIPVSLTIPRKSRNVDGEDVYNFLVNFELIDQNSFVVDKVQKQLDISKFLDFNSIPKTSPIVKVSKSELFSKANLEIRQTDPDALGILVYRKILNPEVFEIEDYSLVGSYELSGISKSILVSVDKPQNLTFIYRVISYGNSFRKSFDFTNVILKPSRYQNSKSAAISSCSQEIGMLIEIRNLPNDAVSIQLVGKNLSTFEKNYRNIQNPIVVDGSLLLLDHMAIVDELVMPYNVYEYAVRVFYKSGVSKIIGNSITQFIPPKPGKIDLSIDNLSISHDGETPNVSFFINSKITDSNMSNVLDLLKRNDIKEFFANNVQNEREFLNGLLAFEIQRDNLSTGEQENFGVITDVNFDDQTLRKNSAVKNLKYGQKYRYQIKVLLRDPETLFKNFVKDKTDPATKKNYKFQPAKFFHPITLRAGILLTNGKNFPQDEFSFGETGVSQNIEVSLDGDNVRLTNPIASKFNRDFNIITWGISGAIETIDHFIIMKDVHGVRTIVGKVHSEFDNPSAQFFHKFNKKDNGEMTYIIIPIFNDYSVGTFTETNSLITEI